MSGGDGGYSDAWAKADASKYSFEDTPEYWAEYQSATGYGVNDPAMAAYTTYKNLDAGKQAELRKIISMGFDQGGMFAVDKRTLEESGLGVQGASYLRDISRRYAEYSTARKKQAADKAAYIAESEKAGAGRGGTILTQQINETAKTVLGSSATAPITILGNK